jgi:hypothetical protein
VPWLGLGVTDVLKCLDDMARERERGGSALALALAGVLERVELCDCWDWDWECDCWKSVLMFCRRERLEK